VTPRRFINPPVTGLCRRLGTRRLESPWPFLLSHDPERRALVLNLPPLTPSAVRAGLDHLAQPVESAKSDHEKRRVFISV